METPDKEASLEMFACYYMPGQPPKGTAGFYAEVRAALKNAEAAAAPEGAEGVG